MIGFVLIWMLALVVTIVQFPLHFIGNKGVKLHWTTLLGFTIGIIIVIKFIEFLVVISFLLLSDSNGMNWQKFKKDAIQSI